MSSSKTYQNILHKRNRILLEGSGETILMRAISKNNQFYLVFWISTEIFVGEGNRSAHYLSEVP